VGSEMCIRDRVWWLPNLFLLLYPLFFISKLLQEIRPIFRQKQIWI